MDDTLNSLVVKYQSRYADNIRSPEALHQLHSHYVQRRESTLLDAAAAAFALDSIFFADEIEFDAITPQMREAFDRAYPNDDLVTFLEGLRGLERESAQALGHLSAWKGVYHEVLIQDRLNDGKQVGNVILGEGQWAALPEDLSQPGFDLQILNPDGTADVVLQAKATGEIGLLHTALSKYPETQILATDEVAERFADERVFSSGFSNKKLNDQVTAPMEEVWDGPVEELLEHVLPFLPFVLITTIEGGKVIMGRQSFERALTRATSRGVKTGAALGVGALLALTDAGMFSLPATVLTRLGIDRVQISNRISKTIERNHTQLLLLLSKSTVKTQALGSGLRPS